MNCTWDPPNETSNTPHCITEYVVKLNGTEKAVTSNTTVTLLGIGNNTYNQFTVSGRNSQNKIGNDSSKFFLNTLGMS